MSRAYYNEHDRHAAAWLRELITAGHIAPGVVDERDIQQVTEADLVGFTQAHFFAGIGGWSIALRLAGWPDDRPVWTGSCPCQPFSNAGKRKGTADARHLWPEMLRLIKKCRPAVVFGEQVASKDGRAWLARVRTDLETLGHGVGAADLCAAGVTAPHIRQRLYWVGDADCTGSFSRGPTTTANGHRRAPLPDGSSGGMAHPPGVPGPEYVHHSRERKGGGANHTANRGGAAGGQGNAAGRRDGAASFGRGIGESETAGRERGTGGSGASGGLGDTMSAGSSPSKRETVLGARRREEGRAAGESGSASNFWSNFDLIPCRDGKARRIEPGTFPLAHGVSGRVGLLRGYGNAICPQVAATFVTAYLEAASQLIDHASGAEVAA